MILDYETVCIPRSFVEHEGEEQKAFGAPGALWALLVSSGQCGLADQPALLADAGNFILAKDAVTLAPVGACHVIGAEFEGLAARQLYGALEGAVVVDGAACPDAPELLYRLQAGAGVLKAAQQSALGYSLLCQLSDADAAPVVLPPLVAGAVEAIREHFAEVYGIEELAAQLGVSKSHLVRSFSAAVGTSPGRYLTAVRLDAAKRLLLHREYPLEVVASLCGFSGANYLCKVFKKATGQTPAAWREQNLPQAPVTAALAEGEERLFL